MFVPGINAIFVKGSLVPACLIKKANPSEYSQGKFPKYSSDANM